MKKQFLAFVLLFTASFGVVSAQEFKETIKKELSFKNISADNTLRVSNIFGDLIVEGYKGSKILIEVEKTISAKHKDDLEKGKEELSVAFEEGSGYFFVHPESPYIKYSDKGFRYNRCDEWPSYDFNMNFTIKVPQDINLKVSTVNDGKLVVRNVKTKFIKANNVNGPIELTNISARTDVNAINGEVDITYVDNPKEFSKYYSLNGDIRVLYKTGLNAEVSFKSMNGDLYTEFDYESMTSKVLKEEVRKKKGIKYRYESRPTIKIGKGGPEFSFETLNGNVIIKKA